MNQNQTMNPPNLNNTTVSYSIPTPRPRPTVRPRRAGLAVGAGALALAVLPGCPSVLNPPPAETPVVSGSFPVYSCLFLPIPV